MAKKDKFDYIENADSLWKMFEKTGNITYYLLYRKLNDKNM